MVILGVCVSCSEIQYNRMKSGIITLSLILLLSFSCKKEHSPASSDLSTTELDSTSVTYRCWQPITLKFEGPEAAEHDSLNPFLDYRLQVKFSQEDLSYVIPGYFAADGNAAESSADSGNIWKVHFLPPKAGNWNYKATMIRGTGIAVADSIIKNEIQTLSLSNATGDFTVQPIDLAAPGFYAKGKLRYTGDRYLQFAGSKDYYLKGGTDSPENFLAYVDFDNTPNKHTYQKHVRDWKEGDPTWQNGKGKGIIGALNYLSAQGMNVVYFLTNNVMGDGDDTWMWTSRNERYRFDCSKLDQWNLVFDHFDRLGILLHLVTQENENQLLLDSGFTDVQRKLYYRELVARFGHHLGIMWNMGEENGPISWYDNLGQSNKQRLAMADYLRKIDPYDNLIVFHTFAYNPPLNDLTIPLLGHKSIDGVALQIDKKHDVHGEVKKWISASADSLQQWVVTNDEIGHWKHGVLPDSINRAHDSIRKYVLWGTYMAGGAGTEWYMGLEDLTVDDFRTREEMWKQTKIALDFFTKDVPFAKMQSDDTRIRSGKAWCYSLPEKHYVVYIYEGTKASIRLNNGDYSYYTLDPKSGERTKTETKTVSSGNLSLSVTNSSDQVFVLRKI